MQPDRTATRGATPPLLDARGYRRPAHTLPGARAGQSPRNRGRKYPPTPPSTDEVTAMLEACRMDRPAERRLQALVIVLWRAGLRISEACQLTEHDLDPREGSIVVRRGKGNKRRIVGMDQWAWLHLEPWLTERIDYPIGELFCVVDGPTAGRAISTSSARTDIRRLALRAGIRHRCAPHQLRHALAVDAVREGIDIVYLSRELGHSNLAVTTTYVQGIAPAEVVRTFNLRAAPQVTALGRPEAAHVR